jgi:GntR family transcriptional regulator
VLIGGRSESQYAVWGPGPWVPSRALMAVTGAATDTPASGGPAPDRAPRPWRPDAEIPLYRQLKDAFLASIDSGEWAPNALIPTELDLAAAYGVSKGPVRQALGQLVREGLLERRQGRGTWVLPRPAEWSTISGTSIARLIEQHGDVHATSVRRFVVTPAAPSVAAGLGCVPGAPIYLIEVVRFAGDQPVALETLHVPWQLLPALTPDALGGRESIYRLLAQAGHRNARSHQSLQAVVVDRYESAALGVARGAPALLLTNRAYDRDDRVLVYSVVLLRGDFFRINISLSERVRSELAEMVRPEIVAEPCAGSAGRAPVSARRVAAASTAEEPAAGEAPG